MAYLSEGTLTTDKREIAISETWDSQTDWTAYQSINNVTITNGTVQLEESQYPSSILARWPFEDESTSAEAIDTVGSNDLLLNGPVYDSTTVHEGDHSLQYSSGDTAPVSAITDPANAWTICGWVYLSTSNRATIYSNRTETVSGEFQLVADGTSSNLNLLVIGGDNASSGLSVPNDTWTFVGCAYDGSGGVTFQVGTQTATGTCGSIASASDNVGIGCRPDGEETWIENLDAVTYYGTNLTTSELADVRQQDA